MNAEQRAIADEHQKRVKEAVEDEGGLEELADEVVAILYVINLAERLVAAVEGMRVRM